MPRIVFSPIYLDQNKGLGNALRLAVDTAKYPLVARMDSDDISISTRFEEQLKCFEQDTELDIVGSDISEFVGDSKNIIGVRCCPATDVEIKQYMKKRCPMNHVSVIFKKSSVQDVGGYIDFPWNEDYYLWVRMALAGCRFRNINENLVNVRTGVDMSLRRGGKSYYSSEKNLQLYMLKNRLIGYPRYLYNVLTRFVGEVLISNKMRAKLFKLFRRVPTAENFSLIESEKLNIKGKPSPIPFSVAICVYEKDNPQWFDLALRSIINQTILPAEIVLVVDGPVPESIKNIIGKYALICENCL